MLLSVFVFLPPSGKTPPRLTQLYMANDQIQWLGDTACRSYASHILGSGAQFVSFGSNLAASQNNCVCVALSKVYQPFTATLQ